MSTHTIDRPRLVPLAGVACAAALLVLAGGCAQKPKPGTYATPEEAVAAAAALVGTNNDPRTDEVFGPGSSEAFHTGDAAEDARLAAMVKQMIAEKVDFEDAEDGSKVALFGNKGWPFPIPLVKDGDRWRFDMQKGREEMLNRRVGFYELSTLSSLHAYVDAQREYASVGRDGKPPAYAQKFRSSPGKHDGLYWEAEGDQQSPLGALLADAATREESSEPKPYHGYNYRILTAQGQSAPGGARNFVDAKGNMTGGFSAIAWPAKYGNSGVMTFVVSPKGIVYQKDLGPQTETLAPAMQAFDPDASWEPTGDTLADVPDVNQELPAAEEEETR